MTLLCSSFSAFFSLKLILFFEAVFEDRKTFGNTSPLLVIDDESE